MAEVTLFSLSFKDKNRDIFEKYCRNFLDTVEQTGILTVEEKPINNFGYINIYVKREVDL